MAQITNIITIHEYNKMTAEQKAALSGDNLLAVVQQDWEEARIQAAIAAMQGQLANDESVKQMIEILGNVALPDKTKAYMNLVARSSVMLADALIEELQKKGGVNYATSKSNNT